MFNIDITNMEVGLLGIEGTPSLSSSRISNKNYDKYACKEFSSV